MVDSPHSGDPTAQAAVESAPDQSAAAPSSPSTTSSRPTNARTCVGCGKPSDIEHAVKASGRQRAGAEPRRPLVRLVISEGEIAVDTGNGSFGRGAYVHAEAPCVASAANKGLARAAKSAVTVLGERITAASLAALICEAYERRSQSLLVAAKRAGRLEGGADAAAAAIRDGDAALVIVAADAAAARELSEVRKMIAEGRVLVWGDKQSLAQRAFGQTREAGVGVVVVTDTRIAAALRESRMIVDALASTGSASGAPSASIIGGGAANLRGPESAVATSHEAKTSGTKVPPNSKNQRGRKNA